MSSLSLVASQRLIELLNNIEHEISHYLLYEIRNKNRQRVSYLDFGNSNDNVSYIVNNKFQELYNSNPENWKELVWTEKRTNFKIGKFIKMIFEEQFPVNQPKDKPSPRVPNDIESFVNKFKAERDKNVNYDRFEIVSGKDIKKWYNQENYTRFCNSETPLGKSCMRYAESGKFLDMYVHNPEIFSMLILKDDQGQLRGRAILWNLEKPETRIYMDRVYSVNDFDIEIFKNYAKDNGWLYRTTQAFGWFNNIFDPITKTSHKWDELLLEVTLKKSPIDHYKYFPYLDTLSVYNKETKVLSNNGNLRTKKSHLLLTDYQGRYHSEVDEREMVFSEIYQQEIPEDDAVFVDVDQSWIYSNDAVYIHNSDGQQAYKNSTKIVKSYVFGNLRYFMKESCVFSEYMNTYIYTESSREAYLDSEKTQKVIIHNKMIGDQFIEIDGCYILNKEYTKSKKSRDGFITLDSVGSMGYSDFSSMYQTLSQRSSSENRYISSRPQRSSGYSDIDLIFDEVLRQDEPVPTQDESVQNEPILVQYSNGGVYPSSTSRIVSRPRRDELENSPSVEEQRVVDDSTSHENVSRGTDSDLHHRLMEVLRTSRHSGYGHGIIQPSIRSIFGDVQREVRRDETGLEQDTISSDTL